MNQFECGALIVTSTSIALLIGFRMYAGFMFDPLTGPTHMDPADDAANYPRLPEPAELELQLSVAAVQAGR